MTIRDRDEDRKGERVCRYRAAIYFLEIVIFFRIPG